MSEVNMDYYATVGYDSPWTQENRRNEVWLVKKKNSDGSVRPNKDKVTSVSSGGNSNGYEEEDYETVPYQVVETKNVSTDTSQGGLIWIIPNIFLKIATVI